MPRLDECHEQVVHALENDGWQVDARPRRLIHEERLVFIDIQAAKGVNGRRQQILLAEVKCFPDRESTTQELYIAFGQYILYRALLAQEEIDLPLYLAVPLDAYEDIFDSTVMRTISDNRIKLVIVNIETETISQWRE
ncbi:MAG: hypothetical protein LCI00_22235 [Chloroflexi bacterium]|nr:hypothetical protein [Chloroflexota bacterium]MCC6895186.1 hypothetical protein [Anaerolineae bacterium]